MNILTEVDKYSLEEKRIESIDFYSDFISFLTRLQEKPIKRTVKGNISLSDIGDLLKKLKTTKSVIEDFKKHGWNLRSENELINLEQIKVLAEVMRLTYKRKNKINLTKKGKKFLVSLSPTEQFKEIILHYWYLVNWDYFSTLKLVNGQSLSNVLQNNQEQLWKFLLVNGTKWIDYEKFCYSLKDYFQLDKYLTEKEVEGSLLNDIELAIFTRNLGLFNCVEIKQTKDEHEWDREIVRFRSTDVGLFLYEKALFQNDLNM